MKSLKLCIQSAVIGNFRLDLNIQEDLGPGITRISGANGSGKTTFLSAVAGARNFSGLSQMDGIDLHKQPNQYKQKVGYCPHNYEFAEYITPCQYLGFVAQCFNREFSNGFSEVYSDIGFQWRRGQLIKDLSYGNRKKLLLLASVLVKPDLWILDEPTNGLDNKAICWLERRLKKFENDCCILIACHDQRWLDKFRYSSIHID